MRAHPPEDAALAAGRPGGATTARIAAGSLLAAALLTALKLLTGALAASLAFISAGIESSGDVLAALVTLFAVRIAGERADRDHPFGHRRAENLGALGEAGLLILGGVIVSAEAIRRLINGGPAPDSGPYVFAVLAVIIAIDLARTSVSLRAARRLTSPALRSNAFHFATDMAGSLAVLAGLLAVRSGFANADAIAALLVAVLVFLVAARLVRANANVLMDRASLEATDAAERAIRALEPQIELRRVRLRESAGRFLGDVVVAVAPGQGVAAGHRAADEVEAAVARALPGSDVVVHVEPRFDGLGLRDGVLSAALAEPLVREVHDITIFEDGEDRYVSLHLKLPDALSVGEAHEVAQKVTQRIAVQTGVREVQTHLEPLERPLVVAGTAQQSGEVRQIEELVRARRCQTRSVRVVATDLGKVLFVTVGLAEDVSLSAAHEAASELEELLRERIADVADVVVHTEP